MSETEPAPALPPKRIRRPNPWFRPGRLLPMAGGLIVLLAIVQMLVWNWMAGRLQAGYDAWATLRREQGWRIEHGVPVRGGWPFTATLRLPEFRLLGGGASLPGGLEWSARAVTLRVALHSPGELRIAAGGPQRLRLGAVEVPFAADRLTAVLPLQANVIPRGGEFEASRLRIGTASGGLEIRSAYLTFDSRMTAIEGEPAVTLQGGAHDVTLPTPTPLGRQVAMLRLDAALTGPLPGGRNPTHRAAMWRDAGGTLELRQLDLEFGPVTARTAATLALDDQLQPMGAGTLRLTGAEALLDALAQDGLITPRNAGLARRVVGVLARPPAEGEPPQLEVPLTLEGRSLAVARMPVARMPVLLWPGPTKGSGPGP
ncbi:DUF2125 domain-containing protein [Roseomonas xinghualingensis]|uniref:DUF2125 domain-containing protein n=1 Tax=Roseomonas xinghualingensis TaxID=2986475 RepID=UPI0021F21F76|nr:DUF2125 domain-containing protein [Roseomonas sp. SXEYE001]MCV4205864.1 DUF2125 domain-containing protein [Roseomonas sp. SXEYE001]